MKVLFISSWYPNSTSSVKGVYVKKHAHAAHRAGAEVVVLAVSVNPSKAFFQKKITTGYDEAGVMTHNIELNSRFYKFIHLDLWWQYAVLKHCYYKHIRPVFKPDLIHSNVLYPAAILGHFLSQKEKLPHVVTEHWTKVDKFMERSLYSNLGRKAYHFAASITVVSEYLRKNVSKYLSKPSKVEIVPNVIDSAIFSYKPKAANPDSYAFSCVANWRTPKRPELIFNAIEYVSKQVSRKFILNVIGEGPLLSELKNKTWNFEVIYHGALPATGVAAVMRDCDYFLHASDLETFSVVIAEALATGTPVLASNIGPIPELINNHNGIVTYNTPQDWADGLFRLLERKDFDHDKIAKEAQRFDEKEIGKQFVDLYKRILANGSH